VSPTVHRAALGLTVAVLLVDLVLYATGVLSGRQAVLLTLCLEVPCAAAVGVATAIAFRRLRAEGLGRRAAWERLLGTTPVRLATAEARSLRALWLTARRRTDPPTGIRLPYGRGLAGTVTAFVLVTAVETVALHLLVPIGWLRDLLAVLSGYALLAVLGLVLSRTAYPHHVSDGRLHLRSGVREVATIDLRDVAQVVVRHRIGVVGLSPSVADGTLHLPSLDGTALDLELSRPGTVSGLRGGRRVATVQRISLHVDDPVGAAALLRAAQGPGQSSCAAARRSAPVSPA
jgi:hypothetical protein